MPTLARRASEGVSRVLAHALPSLRVGLVLLCAAAAHAQEASAERSLDDRLWRRRAEDFSEPGVEREADGLCGAEAAAKHPRGIKLEHSGSGETTFIKAIDDAANEGQGGRNWRYSVNGESGRVSAGIAELKAGDQILWRYAVAGTKRL